MNKTHTVASHSHSPQDTKMSRLATHAAAHDSSSGFTTAHDEGACLWRCLVCMIQNICLRASVSPGAPVSSGACGVRHGDRTQQNTTNATQQTMEACEHDADADAEYMRHVRACACACACASC